MLIPNVITDSSVEPISVTEFKLHSKIDSTVEDGNIEDIYIPAARRYFERRAGFTINEKTLEINFDRWPDCRHFELPWATPLIEIEYLKYTQSDGTVVTWDPANYIADTDNTPGRVVLGYQRFWPSVTLYPSNPIRIRYRAGAAVASPVVEAPGDLKLLLCQMASHFFNNRDAVAINDRGVSINSEVVALTVDSLISNYIQWRF